MFLPAVVYGLFLATPALSYDGTTCSAKPPNIVFVMSDDQDQRLGSTEFQKGLQRRIFAKGTRFMNHFATVSQCCPSRASLLRGQQGHSTNITHVQAPGGNYDKWVWAGEDRDYLPFWLNKAGYRTEYLGKLLNGYHVKNYAQRPKGWDYVDCLVDPYTYKFNNVVMSRNGETPVAFIGYHQTDVIRAKAIDRLQYLAGQEKPFFLGIAPTSPHIDNEIYYPEPPLRYWNDFTDLTAPKLPNWNTPDDVQAQKPTWIKSLLPMNSTQIAFADMHYRRRIQSLQGIDEILEDVVSFLEEHELIENTYVVYTTDNGYYIGNFRMLAGKAMPYAETTNLPFAVRGPGIPAGVVSDIPTAHVDLAPTFMDIARLPKSEWPPFLDGRSLLSDWQNPRAEYTGEGEGVGKELINIEFWGSCHFEAPWDGGSFHNNSYKTLRTVSENFSYLFISWCTNEVELYNTATDPYELYNLAIKPDATTTQLLYRLNAVLLVTKSCAQNSCRDAWTHLQPSNADVRITTLKDAMDPAHDDFFASFPKVHFENCMEYQEVANEMPFYPPGAESLSSEWRNNTDNFVSTGAGEPMVPQGPLQGTWAQRNTTLATMLKTARNLTEAELTGGGNRRHLA